MISRCIVSLKTLLPVHFVVIDIHFIIFITFVYDVNILIKQVDRLLFS